MITYKQAKAIALKANKRVNACQEYEKGYHFFEKEYDGEGDSGVVVVKETGRAINWVDFILDYHPERNPKEIEF